MTDVGEYCYVESRQPLRQQMDAYRLRQEDWILYNSILRRAEFV
jgi:hypothetical protein